MTAAARFLLVCGCKVDEAEHQWLQGEHEKGHMGKENNVRIFVRGRGVEYAISTLQGAP